MPRVKGPRHEKANLQSLNVKCFEYSTNKEIRLLKTILRVERKSPKPKRCHRSWRKTTSTNSWNPDSWGNFGIITTTSSFFELHQHGYSLYFLCYPLEPLQVSHHRNSREECLQANCHGRSLDVKFPHMNNQLDLYVNCMPPSPTQLQSCHDIQTLMIFSYRTSTASPLYKGDLHTQTTFFNLP